jgi:hypothetical protein
MVALPDKLRDREHVAVIDTAADEIQQPRADEPRDNRHSDHGGSIFKNIARVSQNGRSGHPGPDEGGKQPPEPAFPFSDKKFPNRIALTER